MFHYTALYNSVNMKITHMSIHVMESYSAVKKQVTKLKGSHGNNYYWVMKGKQKYLHSVIMFFCKSTQNALYFLFYTRKCHLHTDGVNIKLAVVVSYEMVLWKRRLSHIYTSPRDNISWSWRSWIWSQIAYL